MSDAALVNAFLAQSPACHWVVDRSGIFTRVWGDPSAILRKSAAELEGRGLERALERAEAGLWNERTRRALDGESLLLHERHGETDWNISVYPIRIDDEIRYAGAVAREVTALRSAEQQLRNTVLGALKAMEFEKKSLSKFLHDSIGQNLTAFGLQLDLVRMDLEESNPQVCGRIVEIQKVLEEMMETVREYSYELNPSTVERAGLRPALDRLVSRMRTRFSGSLRLNVDPSLKLDPKVASAMYQIAQEAVENSVQHSACTMIEVTVRHARKGSYIEIRDNGRGFDPADIEGGYRGLGLLSMEQHAAQSGLELTISSVRGKGTTVRASAPKAA